ncbi:MAG: L-rhamnose isomerase [Nioella sp.]
MIPGKQRVNVHAIYSETEEFVDRDRMDPDCFSRWIDWGREQGLSLDFNPTFFAHPKASLFEVMRTMGRSTARIVSPVS